MKKLKTELRLSVGTDGVDSPHLRKFQQSRGGLTNSADNIFGGTYMSRVNKGYDEDLELEDELSDEEIDNLLKEFDIPFIDVDLGDIRNLGKTIYRGGKSAAYSIPGIGDVFSGVSFLWQYFGPFGLRSQVRGFTRDLSELAQVDLGDDFLESESGPATDNILDVRINEAVLRLTNLKDYPDLNVTYLDIVELNKDYDDINDKMRDVLMAFIGFVDAAAGQSGLYFNLGLSILEPEDLAVWIATKYANFIRKVEASGGKGMVYSAAEKALRVAGKPLDYLGNLDLLFNVDKLNRLSAINAIFEEYKGIETDAEKLAKGLKPDAGSLFAKTGDYSDDLKSVGLDFDMTDMSPEDRVEKEKFYHKVFKRAYDLITEHDHNTSLAELYEDDEEEDLSEFDSGPFSASEGEVDEVSAGGVAGAAVPLGREADGSKTTDSILKKRRKDADIYREGVRYTQNWSNRTAGKIKF